MTELTRAIRQLAKDIFVPDSAESARRGEKALVAAWFGVAWLLGLLWPDDIISRPWAQDLVNVMVGIAPWLSDIPSKFSHPIARFHVAALWALMPVTVAVIALSLLRGKRLSPESYPGGASARAWVML